MCACFVSAERSRRLEEEGAADALCTGEFTLDVIMIQGPSNGIHRSPVCV